MMTTASPRDTRHRGTAPLLGATAAALAVGLAATALGATTGGADAAYGALAGTLLAVTVFAFGSFLVNAVAGLMPAAALLVALLTYTLQVLVMGLAFVALSRSGLLDDTLDRQWLGGAVIAGTVLWLVAQLVLTTRLRIPAFEPAADRPTEPATGERGPASGRRAEAGAA